MNSIGSIMVTAFVVVAVAVDTFAAYHTWRIMRKWTAPARSAERKKLSK